MHDRELKGILSFIESSARVGYMRPCLTETKGGRQASKHDAFTKPKPLS